LYGVKSTTHITKVKQESKKTIAKGKEGVSASVVSKKSSLVGAN
jgi:hypothetical protein